MVAWALIQFTSLEHFIETMSLDVAMGFTMRLAEPIVVLKATLVEEIVGPAERTIIRLKWMHHRWVLAGWLRSHNH